MEAPSIDTLLKVAAPAVKTSPSNSPREEGEQFGNYMRDAAEANSVSSEKLVAKSPVAKEKTVDEQPITAAAGQEGSTATMDQETTLTEVAEQIQVTLEEDITEVITDEVILSVAAGVLVEAKVLADAPAVVADIATTVEAPEVTQSVVVPVSAKNDLPTETQPESDRLPAPLRPVDVAENIATDSTQEYQNAEKLVVAELDSPDVEPAEVSKKSVLTSTVELPKPVTAPKSTKPTLPVEATKSEGKEESSKTGKIEPTKVKPAEIESAQLESAKIIEPLTQIVDTPIVTSELNSKEAVTEPTGPTPLTSSDAVTHGPQNQSQPIQPQGSHAEAPVQHAESDSHMPTVDRARFVQRVANAFRSAQQNDGQIQMRLSPPELGSLKIEIAVRNGVLSANLETETPDARRVIMDNLPALRQRLAEQDIRIEKFEVDIRRDGGQQQGQAEAQQQQAEQQSQHAAARNRIRTSQASEVITARVPRSVTTSGNSGLDVRV